jgi:hypothetical protein
MGHPQGYDKTSKLLGYFRIGLYWVMKGHEPSYNFCDVHAVFPYASSLSLSWYEFKYFYTGPRASLDSMNLFPEERSRIYRKVAVQNDIRFTLTQLDVEKGGEADAFMSKGGKTYDVWLFGPLLFLGAPHGTLLVALEGYQSPVFHAKWRKPPLPPQGEIRWPVGNSAFHPCTIYGNDYADYPLGAEKPNEKGWSTWPFRHHRKEIGALVENKKDLKPVRLPDFAQGAAWRVEAYSESPTTQYECYTQHG